MSDLREGLEKLAKKWDEYGAIHEARELRALLAAGTEKQKDRHIGGFVHVDDVIDAAFAAAGTEPAGAGGALSQQEYDALVRDAMKWRASPPPAEPGLLDEAISACIEARSAIDYLMGDTDLPEDDSDEMTAMQMLSAVIARYEASSK